MKTTKLLTLAALTVWTAVTPAYGQTVFWERKAHGEPYVVYCPPPDPSPTTNNWPNNNNWSQEEHWGVFCTPPNTNWYETQPSNWSTPKYPNGPTYDVILGSIGGGPTYLDVSVTLNSLTILPDGGLNMGYWTTATASRFDFQGDGTIDGGNTLKIADGGSLTKSGGAGKLTIGPWLNLIGLNATIAVSSGELCLRPVGANNACWTNFTYIVAANATNSVDLDGWMWWYGTHTGLGAGTFLLRSGSINFDGATLNFQGPMFQWTGGKLGAYGLAATNLGAINLAGDAPKELLAVLNNRGTLNYGGSGGLDINGSNGGRLNNLGSGTVNLQSDASITDGPIYNWGLFHKSGGTGTSMVLGPFNNLGGTIQVDTGTLTLAWAGISSNGTFNVSAGAVLDLTGGSGPHYQGNLVGSGNGTVALASGGLYIDSPGASFNFPGPMFQWTGGELGAYGLAATNLGTINVAGDAPKRLTAVLNNSGTLNYGGSGSLDINNSNGGRFTNLVSGTVNLQYDATIDGDVANWGIFRKSAGTGTFTFSGPFYNQNGSIGVDSGTLRLATGNYAQGTGALSIGLGGRGLGQSGQLSVAETANLGGPLNVFLTNGFALATGDQFQILACGTRSGTFSTASLPAGTSLEYSSTGVSLVVTGALPVLITSPALSGTNFRLSFNTLNNQSYTVERNDNLGTTNWVFQTNFFGNGSLMQVVVPVTNATQRFFRVRQP
jgi:hypothetical protein